MKKIFITSTTIWILLILTTVCIVTENCNAQTVNFKYKPLPLKYLPPASALTTYHLQVKNAKNGMYDLTNSLPQGYVIDGSVDYTEYLQKGINSNSNVVFPDFPVLVNTKGLALISNSKIIFQRKSKLIMMPNDHGNYQILILYNIQNVVIYFPVLEGDRDKHTGTTGEWGHGLNISGSSAIQIINPKISKCWGDGIYIGKTKQQGSKNIEIDYAVLDYNRRNGISIINVDSLSLVHPVISNTSGTAPMAGIDVEPNDNKDVINRINIDGPITFNSIIGINLELIGLPGQTNKDVNIVINNHTDEQSATAFGIGAFPKLSNVNEIKGNIKIINPVWKDNAKVLYYAGEFKEFGPVLEFKNVTVKSKNVVHPEALDKEKNALTGKDRILFH